MSESKASEDYKAFESLRSRFKDENSSSSSSPSRPEPRKSGKRRFDPRANAPPLVPLIEEGDILQEIKSSSSASSPVKGRWKHSNQLKSNHLNGPDFDPLETSSTASLSSAFSEPGNFSPVLGSSLSELSDAGSCETFSEYDIKRTKSRITSLKTPFEHSPSGDSLPSRPSNKPKSAQLDVDVPENFVNSNKRAWDKVIGEWKFSGIPQAPLSSASKPKMRRPSSEVRVPTTHSTPLGSMDNLLTDSESRSSILSNNESNCSDEYTNFDRRLPLRQFLNKPPSRPSSASCVPTGTKRNTLTMAAIDDRSSSETDLAMQKSSRDEEYKVDMNSSEKTQYSSTPHSDIEGEDNVPQLPNQYKLGKFISISDTMLPTEERIHEYISEGPTSPTSSDPKDLDKQDNLKPVQPEEPVVVPAPNDNSKVEENWIEDEAPIHYQPGKFVSQTTSVTTPDLEETEEDMKAENTSPPTPPVVNPVREHLQEEDVDKPTMTLVERARTPPSNRWFDAYMKCRAQQARQKKPNSIAAKKLPANQPPPVEKPQKESSPVNDLQVAIAETDNFERVQTITPSKSHKWLEAMRKYKALKSDMEQNISTQQSFTTIREGDEPISTQSSETTPKRSAEEPTFTTLAQRAQVFGGMRKRPPLRRAKSFQIGSDNASSSPLATGLSKPTRVLKKQITASFA